MKKTMMILAAMAFAGSVASVQVVPSENDVKGCERLGEVAAGNRFMQMDRETAEKAVREQAKEMNADKVFLSVTSHTHPKLGKQYTAKAVAWKCDK
jgi:hypothetical protein